MKNIFRITGVTFLLLSIFLTPSCKKDKLTPPELTTSAVTAISYTTATSGGNVTNLGGATFVARGICWNTSTEPTISNNKTLESSGMGTFTSNLTQLTPNTLYYVRAFATNGFGTSYGNQVSFTTSQIAIPVLTTTEITSITQTSAVSGGNITDDKGGSVTARGICWSTLQNPTISDNKTSDGYGTGTFTSSMTGLISNTVYYARAYATNNVGTGYGNEITFTLWINQSGPQVIDVDGNSYNSVKIGNQVWMTENLKTTKYSDGTPIPLINSPATWDALLVTDKAYSWYNDDISNKATYGALYTWAAAMNGASSNISNPSGVQGVCPDDWHLPSDAEWSELTDYLGDMNIAGGKMKEIGITHWLSPNTGATNESGFTALPSGTREINRSCYGIGANGYWWSATEGEYRYIGYDISKVNSSYDSHSSNKIHGFSIRCVKD